MITRCLRSRSFRDVRITVDYTIFLYYNEISELYYT